VTKAEELSYFFFWRVPLVFLNNGDLQNLVNTTRKCS
jgi:hypothetical protein